MYLKGNFLAQFGTNAHPCPVWLLIEQDSLWSKIQNNSETRKSSPPFISARNIPQFLSTYLCMEFAASRLDDAVEDDTSAGGTVGLWVEQGLVQLVQERQQLVWRKTLSNHLIQKGRKLSQPGKLFLSFFPKKLILLFGCDNFKTNKSAMSVSRPHSHPCPSATTTFRFQPRTENWLLTLERSLTTLNKIFGSVFFNRSFSSGRASTIWSLWSAARPAERN